MISLLLALAMPQIVGGDWPQFHRFDGQAAGDFFGYQVVSAGDVDADGADDILVSAPDSSSNYWKAGSVYVYSGLTGSLLYQWNGTSSFEQLGQAIAPAGDLNQDGYADILIGNPHFLTQSAFVYSGADGSTLLTIPGSPASAFGLAVALAGDVDGDGRPDYIISAPNEGVGGVAYLISGATGTTLFSWAGSNLFDNYGQHVSGAGDVNGDGFPDILIGSPLADYAGVSDKGTVEIFSGFDGSLLYQWVGLTPNEQLGISVHGQSDINGDGFDDILFGSLYADSPSYPATGSATVCSGADGSILFEFFGTLPYEFAGKSVSFVADMNQDGVDDILVGAPSAHSPSGIGGRVDLYSGANGTLLHQWFGEVDGSSFGESIAQGGDANADGLSDVLIGAQFTDYSATDAGSAYVLSFAPLATASTDTISIASGTHVVLTMDFPTASAGYDYFTLMSLSGTGPLFYGVEIPMTLDSFLLDSASGIYPFPQSNNLHGILDVNGNASADFDIPSNLVPPSLIGVTFWLATVAMPSGQLPAYSSVAMPFTFAP